MQGRILLGPRDHVPPHRVEAHRLLAGETGAGRVDEACPEVSHQEMPGFCVSKRGLRSVVVCDRALHFWSTQTGSA